MSKGTFFTGQPIFNQVLNFIPRSLVSEVARELNGDHYYKTFKTYEHLVTMLYVVFNQCTCLRETTTGLLAWDKRIQHLGINAHPRRSTFSDANSKRNPEIFEKIYLGLLKRYIINFTGQQPGNKERQCVYFRLHQYLSVPGDTQRSRSYPA